MKRINFPDLKIRHRSLDIRSKEAKIVAVVGYTVGVLYIKQNISVSSTAGC